jgi:hypothetical protein
MLLMFTLKYYTLQKSKFRCSAANFSNTGAIALQGLHQVAETSTTTYLYSYRSHGYNLNAQRNNTY